MEGSKSQDHETQRIFRQADDVPAAVHRSVEPVEPRSGGLQIRFPSHLLASSWDLVPAGEMSSISRSPRRG